MEVLPIDDDPFDYPLIDENATSSSKEREGQRETYKTYQAWDLLSKRVYAPVSIHEYTVSGDDSAERYYLSHPDRFAHDMRVLVDRHTAHAINFRVIAINPETEDRSEVTLRINTEDGLDEIADHIREATAPPYLEGEGGSDNTSGATIIWSLGWVQLISQPEAGNVVTMVVGTSTMIPGYVTKVINTADHGVTYSTADCLFICLNEALGIKHNPDDVRRTVLGNYDLLSPINVESDLVKLARYYRCNIAMHSVDDGTRSITSKDKSLPTVRLVKMGMAVGIIEGVSEIVTQETICPDSCNAYYDFETVSDSTTTQVYAFSLIWVDGRRACLLHHDPDALAESIRVCFRDLIRDTPDHISSIYLHAWNGSRFDHPLLLRMCNKKFKLGFIVTNGQREVLSGSIRTMGKSLMLRDPCKMFPCSLQAAHEILGIQRGKLDADHIGVETAYLRGDLAQYITSHKRDIEPYAMRDVELLKQVTEYITHMYTSSGISYNSCLTRNMASVALWKKSLTSRDRENLSSIQFSYSELVTFSGSNVNAEYIKEQAIGGRVQGIRGKHKHVTLLDFRSMYPSVAIEEQYPCGSYRSVTDYIPGKLGLYLVTIPKQSYPYVVPHRASRHKAYDWNYGEEFDKLLTNVDVECLYESGVKIDVKDGIVWDNSTNYFGEHMTTLYKKRNESRASGDSVMAEHYKHMANSLTGALFQQLRREYVKVFSNHGEAEVYVKMYSRYVHIVHELIYDNGQIMLYFIPKKLTNPQDLEIQKEVCKGATNSKPIALTMFIYAYARKKLWQMWRHIEDSGIGTIVYCDTDSLAVAAAHNSSGKLVNVSLRLKEYIGIEMGQLEVVMSNSDMVVISPKVYAMRDMSGSERIRVRGIDRRSTLYLLRDDTTWVMEMEKTQGWEYLRSLHSTPLEKLRATLDYDTIASVLKGDKLLSVYWYYSRANGTVLKKYGTKVLTT